MAEFLKVFLCLFFIVFVEEIFSLPLEKDILKTASNPRFLQFIPKDYKIRQRREEEEQPSGSGIQELLTTVIKDGIAASSAMDSPTMFVGGFSIMMQPMPNGTEFAGQLMQMAPHYMNLIPGVGGK